jgi:hypothetical protein
MLYRPVLHALSIARRVLKDKFPTPVVPLTAVLPNCQVFLPGPAVFVHMMVWIVKNRKSFKRQNELDIRLLGSLVLASTVQNRLPSTFLSVSSNVLRQQAVGILFHITIYAADMSPGCCLTVLLSE